MNHPDHCPACRGSGWMDGPPIVGTVEGKPHEWTTVKPCSRDWWNDDPTPHQGRTPSTGAPPNHIGEAS